MVLTITADNGKEFAGHVTVSVVLSSNFFFAYPYHSWERDLNEHANDLVREYFPKGTDFLQISDEEGEAVQNRLNVRPKKAPGYRTPTEVLHGTRVR